MQSEEVNMKASVAVVAAALILASPTTAARVRQSSDQDPVITRQIIYSDLDLSSVAGQSILKERISFAASRMCLVDAPDSPTPPIVDPICVHKAMNDGLAQMQRAIAALKNSQLLASTSPLKHR
jgi:UrcA family protein